MLAYTPSQRDFRTWKRYRGGMASDIWLFNLDTLESEQITDFEGTDTLPMWNDGIGLLPLRHAGPEHRLNIWAYDPDSGRRAAGHRLRRVSTSSSPSVSGDPPRDRLPERAEPLPARSRANGSTQAIEVTIPGAKPDGPHRGWSTRPSTFRPVASARPASARWSRRAATSGPIPAEKGAPRQLTDTSGAAERDPGWSPRRPGGSPTSPTRAASTTSTSPSPTARARPPAHRHGRRTTGISNITWSPDSEKLALHRQGRARCTSSRSRAAGALTEFDKRPDGRHALGELVGRQPLGGLRPSRTRRATELTSPSGSTTPSRRSDAAGDRRLLQRQRRPRSAAQGDYLYYTSNRSSPRARSTRMSAPRSSTPTPAVLIAVPLNAEVENPGPHRARRRDLGRGRARDEDEDLRGRRRARPRKATRTRRETKRATTSRAQPDRGHLEPARRRAWRLWALPDATSSSSRCTSIRSNEDGSYYGRQREPRARPDRLRLGDVRRGHRQAGHHRSQGPINTTTTKARSAARRSPAPGPSKPGMMEGSGAVHRHQPELRRGARRQDQRRGRRRRQRGRAGGDRPSRASRPAAFALPVSPGAFNNLLSNDKGALLYNSFGSRASPPSVKIIDGCPTTSPKRRRVTGAADGLTSRATARRCCCRRATVGRSPTPAPART